MQQIFYHWTLLYYFLTRLEKKIGVFVFPLYRIIVLFGIRFTKRKLSEEQLRREFDNMNNQKATSIADIQISILAGFIFISFVNFLSGLLQISIQINLGMPVFVLLGWVLSAGLNYLLLWKNDRFLEYFKTFDTFNKETRRRGDIICIMLILIILSTLIASYVVLLK